MLYWLGVVCGEQREARGRLQVHIAATLGMNQESVGRFERGSVRPRDVDVMVAAYAEDLEIDGRELWRMAVERYLREGRPPVLDELLDQ